jgi:hypothetical protein
MRDLDDMIDETADRIKAMPHNKVMNRLNDRGFWNRLGPSFTRDEAEALACLLYRAGEDLHRCASLVVESHDQQPRGT